MEKELRVRLFANDRILKALVALLAERDPSLLSDLRLIFTQARTEGSEVADNTRATWEEINRELQLIADLAGEEDNESHWAPASDRTDN
jgi:hypothetical protein